MPFLLTLANLGLVLASSILLVSLLRLRSRVAHLVAVYVVSYADIVLVLELAGILNALNRRVVFALQVVVTCVAALLWLRRDRPALLGPFSGFRVRGLWRDWPSRLKLISIAVMALAVAYIYARQAQLILAIFPYNYDALTYHLSRVAYWLQYHSLYPWPTPNPRQTTFPMNAELAVLWTVLWWGTDRLSGFVQWTAVPAIMLSILGMTRLLGYSRWQGAMVALLWATLAQVVYQSSSAQNDLVTTIFWVAALYFLIAGLRENRAQLHSLSGLALGLAIGTKETSLMVLPGLGLAALVAAASLYRRAELRRRLILWPAACLVALLLFGSYAYVQNTVAFGRPLGPNTGRTGAGHLQPEGGILTYAQRLRDNVGRYLYQAVDFAPLPLDLATEINPSKAAGFSGLFQGLRIPIENSETIAFQSFDFQYVNPLDENASWFGPLAIALIVAAAIQAYVAASRLDFTRIILLIISVAFLVVQSAAERWTPFKGRYYLIPVAVSFPLMACLIDSRTVWRGALAAGLMLIGLAVMFTVTQNMNAFKHISWRDAFAEDRKLPAWPNEFQFFMFKRDVPPDASIGITGGSNFQDYPFFGEDFAHYVTLALPDDPALLPNGDVQRFQKDFEQSDYLLLSRTAPVSDPDSAPDGFELLGDDGLNSLWVRKGLRPPDTCDDSKWPFRDFFRAAPDSGVCAQFPITPPHAKSDPLGTVYIEGDRYIPVLSSRPNGFLQFNLLAKRDTQLRLTLRVDPQGYATLQTLQLLLSTPNAEPQLFTTEFSGKGLVRFNVPLPRGSSTARFSLADSPLEVSVISIQAAAP